MRVVVCKNQQNILKEPFVKTKLGEVCNFKQGNQFGLEEQLNYPHEGYVRFLRIENYTQNSMDFRFVKVDDENKIIDEKDIVIVRYGASAGYVGRGFSGVLANNLFRVIPKERLDREFLYYLLTDERVYDYFQKSMIGGAMPALSFKIVENLKVQLPSLPEQQKIASILSTWDKAIELKEKLIEQKKQQKKGLMQKLLTGEVRLPGFEGEWEEVKLGELGDFKTSSVDKKVNKNDIEILLVNYMDVYHNRVIDNTIDFMKVTATEKQIETFNVQYGDVLFTPSSETPDDIGHSAVVKVDSAKILYSYHLVRLRFKREMDVDFKAYVFNSSNLLREFSKRATGATRYTLSLSDFKESTIRIPKDITEQKAIGTVLLNSEREIRLLKKELEMLKQQKKGLMQLLLTGKVRVQV